MKRFAIALSLILLAGAGCGMQGPDTVRQEPDAPYDGSGTGSGAAGGTSLAGERTVAGMWELRTFTAKGKAAQDVTKEGATLDLTAAGRLSGQVCNVMNGSYAFQDGVLKATDVISTKRFCAGISGEMETAFLQGVQAGLTAGGEGDTLTLRTSDGAEFSFSRKPGTGAFIDAEPGTGSPSMTDTSPSGDRGTGTPSMVDTRPSGDRWGLDVGEPNPATKDRAVSGTVTAVDLSKIPVDGPAMITVKTATGSVEIHAPSFGMNLCAAGKDIADPYKLKVGDAVEANGAVSEEDVIVPCTSASHYLRVTKK